jgi:hypothetical protein
VAFLELEQMLRSVGSAEALTALLRDAELTRQVHATRNYTYASSKATEQSYLPVVQVRKESAARR